MKMMRTVVGIDKFILLHKSLSALICAIFLNAKINDLALSSLFRCAKFISVVQKPSFARICGSRKHW